MQHSSSDRKISSAKRKRAEKLGRRAEFFAGLFLRAKFFSILQKRYKTPIGEIDIIARRGDLLIFVEIKLRRKKSAIAEALQAVNRRRIVGAAKHYLAKNPHLAEKNMRFDVIFLAPFVIPVHLKGAFEAH